MEKWKKETGKQYLEFEIANESQREQALRRLAESGANPVVMTGFAFGDVLNQVAPDFPNTKFAIILPLIGLFMLPGLVATCTAVAVGFVIAKFVL